MKKWQGTAEIGANSSPAEVMKMQAERCGGGGKASGSKVESPRTQTAAYSLENKGRVWSRPPVKSKWFSITWRSANLGPK